MRLVPRVSAPGTGLGATERCYDIKVPMGRAKSKCWRELVFVFCEILFGGNAGLAGGRLWHQAVATQASGPLAVSLPAMGWHITC